MDHPALYKVFIRSAWNSSRGRLVTMHSYVTFCVDAIQNFFRMAPDQCDTNINIEGFLIWEIKIAEGVTEKLKCTRQMEWVQRCNNIHNRAEEIILHEMIYL